MPETPVTQSPVPQTQDAQLSPQLVLDEMKKNGVTHVVWLPDSETNFLYQLMQADPSLQLVPVSREGLAFSIAAALATAVETSADAPRISIAVEEARRTQRPVAVLMADEYHGFNR